MRPILAALVLLARPAAAQPAAAPLVPDAPRGAASDTYFGTAVPDPYRWLEDTDAPAVRAWYAAENAAAEAYLDARPAQARVLAQYAAARAARPVALLSYAEAGGRIVSRQRRPDEQSASVYVRDVDMPDAPERRLLAPADVGPGAVLARLSLSPTGEHVAVTAVVGGAESAPVVRVVETATGRVLDELPPRASDVVWLPGGRRFLYTVRRDGARDATGTDLVGGRPLLVHTLGTDARTAPDPVAFDAARWGGDAASITFPSTPLPGADLVFVAYAREDSDRWDATFAAPVAATGTDARWQAVSAPADSVVGVFARGSHLYAVAFRGSPTGRLVRVPNRLAAGVRPDWAAAETVVPAGGVDFWQQAGRVAYARDAVYTVETAPGTTRLFRTAYDGARTEIAAPAGAGEGSFEQPVADPARDGADVFFSGWTTAVRRYRFTPGAGLAGGRPGEGRLAELPAFYNPPDPFGRLDGLVAETREAVSHDGVRVPVTLLRVPGAPAAGEAAGPRPTILYGYSSYGHTEDPYFRAEYRPWLAAGGQVAVCHARGGGYHGPAWHAAGTRAAKPNTWLDGVACAEALVADGLAVPAGLGIQGVSAGGIFVGRAVETRPALFGAAVAEVGWSDLVRLSTGSVGPGNEHEFGSPETEAGFRALLAMSAYEHVDPEAVYPPVLVYAAFNDSRVAPWHPAKWVAALRWAGGADALPAGTRPVLLLVDFETGHGMADTVGAREARAAAVLAFFADRLGLPMP